MKKKKLLVIAPYTPNPSYIAEVVSPLAFLDKDYDIETIDSLLITDEVSNEVFYGRWEQKLMNLIPHYDAFFGFSFGGVILQQCFSLFANCNKPIVLFSTPSFADTLLNKKLGNAISLCEKNNVVEALVSLYQHVFYPNPMPQHSYETIDHDLAAKRLIYSFKRLLSTDSRPILSENETKTIHLIGERSDLVNLNNVVAPNIGQLYVVPEAGMRMLGDNPNFCKKIILETLNGES